MRAVTVADAGRRGHTSCHSTIRAERRRAATRQDTTRQMQRSMSAALTAWLFLSAAPVCESQRAPLKVRCECVSAPHLQPLGSRCVSFERTGGQVTGAISCHIASPRRAAPRVLEVFSSTVYRTTLHYTALHSYVWCRVR